mgnify:CR=1 FL=1
MKNRDVANGIVFKIEDNIHMFLLDDEGNILDTPSIPITDYDNVYDNLKDSQIQFMNVEFEKIDPDDSIDFNDYDDFTKLQYRISDLFTTTLGNGETEDDIVEVSVLQVLKDGSLSDIVHSIFMDKYK